MNYFTDNCCQTLNCQSPTADFLNAVVTRRLETGSQVRSQTAVRDSLTFSLEFSLVFFLVFSRSQVNHKLLYG